MRQPQYIAPKLPDYASELEKELKKEAVHTKALDAYALRNSKREVAKSKQDLELLQNALKAGGSVAKVVQATRQATEQKEMQTAGLEMDQAGVTPENVADWSAYQKAKAENIEIDAQLQKRIEQLEKSQPDSWKYLNDLKGTRLIHAREQAAIMSANRLAANWKSWAAARGFNADGNITTDESKMVLRLSDSLTPEKQALAQSSYVKDFAHTWGDINPAIYNKLVRPKLNQWRNSTLAVSTNQARLNYQHQVHQENQNNLATFVNLSGEEGARYILERAQSEAAKPGDIQRTLSLTLNSDLARLVVSDERITPEKAEILLDTQVVDKSRSVEGKKPVMVKLRDLVGGFDQEQYNKNIAKYELQKLEASEGLKKQQLSLSISRISSVAKELAQNTEMSIGEKQAKLTEVVGQAIQDNILYPTNLTTITKYKDNLEIFAPHTVNQKADIQRRINTITQYEVSLLARNNPLLADQVEVVKKRDKLLDQLGFNSSISSILQKAIPGWDPEVALSNGKIDVTKLPNGGQLVLARLQKTWLEAYELSKTPDNPLGQPEAGTTAVNSLYEREKAKGKEGLFNFNRKTKRFDNIRSYHLGNQDLTKGERGQLPQWGMYTQHISEYTPIFGNKFNVLDMIEAEGLSPYGDSQQNLNLVETLSNAYLSPDNQKINFPPEWQDAIKRAGGDVLAVINAAREYHGLQPIDPKENPLEAYIGNLNSINWLDMPKYSPSTQYNFGGEIKHGPTWWDLSNPELQLRPWLLDTTSTIQK